MRLLRPLRGASVSTAVLTVSFAAAAPPEPEADDAPDGEALATPADDAGAFVFTSDSDAEVIHDPELAGVPLESRSPPKPPPAIRVELHSRIGVDTRWEDPREDVVEATQIAIFEATYRRSEHLRFAAGLRVRHISARREDDSVQGRAARYELDVVPLSAYADATLDDGVHLRAGYQILSMGRFDFFSATNFLAAYDLRQGLTTMPEATEVGQPAVRLDVDPTPWLSLQSIYVPFFQPHLVTLYGTDYAMLSILDRVSPATTSPTIVSSFVDGAIERSDLGAATTGAIRAFGPQPTPTQPQGAVRATARWRTGEVSATAGTAMERLPALIVSPELEAFLQNPSDLGTQIRLLQSSKPLDVRHDRFSVVSTDAAFDVGPLQLGAEVAYMMNRTFYAARSGSVPRPETSDVLHVAGRAELVETDVFLAALEAFHARALDAPSERGRTWMTLADGKYLQGVALATSFSPGAFTFEVAATASTGPTYFLAPRVELEVLPRFYVEAGAFISEGPAPEELGQPDVSVGGIYDTIDQVFVGARWLP